MKENNDACQHCVCRGDMKSCIEANCHVHDSWFAEKLQAVISTLHKVLTEGGV